VHVCSSTRRSQQQQQLHKTSNQLIATGIEQENREKNQWNLVRKKKILPHKNVTFLLKHKRVQLIEKRKGKLSKND